MTRSLTGTIIILLLAFASYAQVDAIKGASSSKSSGETGGSSGGGAFVGNFFFQFMFSEMIQAQQNKLQQRYDIPSLVSFDVLLQTAVQPSSYYVINPRIRGNWGIFSSDFRLNYILEEDIEGVKYLRTNDWQILQLNLITTKEVTVRVGGGVIYEAFGQRNNYPEWTAGVHIRPFGEKLGGIVEYRGSEARKEVNAHLRYTFFERAKLHGYLTAGAVYQRYYSQINVWGMQGGIAMSIF